MRKIIVPIGSLVIVFFIFTAVNALTADPGSMADPVVTKSYVLEQISKLKTEITGKTSGKADPDTNVVSTPDSMKFKAIQIKANKKLIGFESCEIILRSGIAKAIASSSGGLQDITDGKDVNDEENITKYHLLIVPKSDGRGISTHADTWVMVRGQYEIVD